MSIRLLFSATLFTFIHIIVSAQTDADALRYSSPAFTGTARSIGIGGALTGLGGDISSLGINPAGIAQMGISEFSFTGGLSFTGSSTEFLGGKITDEKAAVQINHAGVVFVPKKNFKNIKNISIGASYNRLSNFSDKTYASGINNNSSLSDSYAETLNFAGVDSAGAASDFPFDASLAFLGEIVRIFPGDIFGSILELPIQQQITLSRSGSMSEFNIGAGFALNDYVMLGIGLGIPTISYEENYFFKETDKDNVTPDFNYWEKRDILRTEGAGINAKLGILVQPTPYFRLGASFITPTRFSLQDTYTTLFRSDFDQFTIDNFNTPVEGLFDYNLTTPLRTNFGIAFLSSKLGLISVDYEYTDPSKAKFRFDDQNLDFKEFETQINNTIESKYTATHSLRAGIEGKIKDYFRVRGGFQYRTSSFGNQESFDDLVKNTQLSFSAGAGYRGRNYYLDATYFQTFSDQLLVPYSVTFDSSPTAVTQFKRYHLMITFGLKF